MATADKDPGCLTNRAGHVGDDLEGVVGDGQVEAAAGERQGRTVGEHVGAGHVRRSCVAEEGKGGIDAGDPMATGGQVTGNPALAAADLDASCAGEGRIRSRKASR